MKSITGVEFNNSDICVRGTTFGCLCLDCRKRANKRIKIIMNGGVPDGITKESSDTWRSLLPKGIKL